eukprot:13004601-Alexandrium_andersonii.AAC.1
MLAKVEVRLCETIAQNDQFSENLDVVVEPGKEFPGNSKLQLAWPSHAGPYGWPPRICRHQRRA